MYQYFNAHPKGKRVGDCVKRAITKATGMDYMEVQRQLNRYKKVTGASSYNTDYNPHKYVENVLHGEKLSFPAKAGQKRMTAGTFSEKYPQGKYILLIWRSTGLAVWMVLSTIHGTAQRSVFTRHIVLVKRKDKR